ncbi:MAG TPA: signal peptide peptidase SppA [bacterium]|nr:signal peptide peptidase SppA [bacterium]
MNGADKISKTLQRALAAPVAGRVIGKIKIFGPIMPVGASGSHFGGSVNPDRVIQKIKWAESLGIRSLIFEINSPGGSVVPSKEIADAVRALRMPTVAWVRDLAASGAYWIASACDRIVADPCSGVGSIGVISTHIEFSELMKKYGVSYEGFKTGEFKDMGVPFRKFTSSERKSLQSHINKIHEMFVKSVAENRGLDPGSISDAANGNLYLGEEAKRLGLVDRLGSRREAILQCEQLGNFKHLMVAEIEDFREEFFFALRSMLSYLPAEFGRAAARGFFDSVKAGPGADVR